MSPQKPSLRETALKTQKDNPSQLGDPTSLKAETSSTSPTSNDKGAGSIPSKIPGENLQKIAPAPTESDESRSSKGAGKNGERTLRQRAMDKLEENPSQLGDPVSLKAEKADSEPTDQDRGARGKSKL